MRPRRQAVGRTRLGAAALELALWLPFLGLMFVVAIDFCRIFHCSQTIQNCACAGALYASGNAQADTSGPWTSTMAISAALDAAVAEGTSLNPPLTTNQVSVAYVDGRALVTVTYPFPLLTQWPGSSGTRMVVRSVQMDLAPKAPGS